MMEGGERHRRWKTIVAVLLSCSLALGLTYFSWRGLTNAVKVIKSSEVKEHDVFNGKELEFESGSSAAVTTEMGINDASVQADSKVTGDNMVKGAAWSASNSSLHCGRNKMKFQVMGPGAAELQLDMGNDDPVPLSQAPGSCGILVKQTLLGLLLLVPYDCAVKQGNGTYVLMMRWRESAVNITCTTLPNADADTTAEPTDVPIAVLPHYPLNLYRMKRHLRWHPMYVPCSPHRRFPLCRYTTPPPTTTTTASTTTANPHPPTINPLLWKKLHDLYPLYKHYIYGNHHPLHRYYNVFKYPRWQGAPQAYKNPHILNYPIQLLEGYLAQTPPPQTAMPTMTSAYCPHSRRVGHFHKFPFVPRMSFEIPAEQQNVPDRSYTSGYQGPENPDSFWESFPLLYHSESKDDPRFDWEHQTPN
ncbi:uncharacterized protein LOC105935903 [Fundulus heteroclitus]|uniref:uncharacterized protein LOC105935903 n=1 Tax=Fundulus heteroclitus TaxID=8078 RepID=UPI00165BAD45|nr:uncharacterized protein LOC105935903 [Fundulus heteroclitus]